jgi:hypothetical protein
MNGVALTSDGAPWWIVVMLAIAGFWADEIAEARPRPAPNPPHPLIDYGTCWALCGGYPARWEPQACECRAPTDAEVSREAGEVNDD